MERENAVNECDDDRYASDRLPVGVSVVCEYCDDEGRERDARAEEGSRRDNPELQECTDAEQDKRCYYVDAF